MKRNDSRSTGRALGWPALALFGALLAHLACAPGSRPANEPTYRRAPIVLVSIDTLRADHLPAWGYTRGETPAIDVLARESIRFANAFSPCPLTLPAHLSILSGLTPVEHGVRDNLGYAYDGASHPTLASWLRPAGYARGAAVSAYVLRGASGLGGEFDFYDDELPGVRADLAAAAGAAQRPGSMAADRLLAWIGRQGDRPFFAWLHLYEPHTPYAAPAPFAARLADPYDAEIAAADAVVGRFLGALRASGIYDRAIVVLLSDHGEGLGEHGEAEHGILLNRWALHVPLLLKLPQGERGGETVDTPVALIDVAPTLSRLVGVAAPAAVGERSLLDGERLTRRAERGLYAETYYPRIHLGWSEQTGLLATRFHLIEGGGRELYDWRADPRELEERSAAEPERVRELAAALARQRGAYEPPGTGNAEEVAAMRSLGYLGGSATHASGGDLPAPRARIHLIAQLSSALRLAAAGQNEAAASGLREVLRESPELFDAQVALAEVSARAGRPAEALSAYERACALSPALASGLVLPMARLQLELGRFDEAERHARAGAAGQPGAAELLLARIAMAKGDPVGAEQAARRAEQTPDAWPGAATIRAELRLRAGAPEEALAILDAAEERRRGEGGEPVADLEFLRGEALGRVDRLGEAEQAFRREIAAFPTATQAYSRLALVLGLTGHGRREVEEVLEAMVARRPDAETAALARRTLSTLQGATLQGASHLVRDHGGR
ncbi:MAG: sulfatase-like hydrolase/transferase [Holophagales bacterium]|nr:MAG: sulfatase-like hydrolase/transferase [Holophagales bacterium]